MQKSIRSRRNTPGIFLVALITIFAVILSSQSANAAAKVSKSEYQAYMKSMRAFVSAENSILTKYGSVTGDNYTDDQTLYDTLVELTPEMNRFIGRIEKIQPKNSTLRSIHKLYVSGWNLQYEAVLLCLQALDDQSYAGIAKSNKVLSQGRAQLADFRAKLQSLGY
jgi:hypothetical protein